MSISLSKQNLKRFGLPVGVLVLAAVTAKLILSNPPEARRMNQAPVTKMSVEVQPVIPRSYQVNIDSFGIVKPRTESVLVSQAGGQINQINPNFRDGGFFEQGDILLTIDDRDHRADVKVSQANLLEAKQQLAEEQARGKQAEADWKRLGKGGTPNDLVLRKPQLEAAKAKVLSAEAQLEKAQLALERTQIIAPYAGRILNKHVDVGQVVSTNTQLADIYAVDYVEIRLPINNQDLALITLPEEFRFNDSPDKDYNRVVFTADIGNNQQWYGQVVRTEGAIDENSQQLYIVAQIDNPYGRQNTNRPIKIGQYVNASITGKRLDNVLVIDNRAVYQGSYVYIVEDGVLKRKNITIGWKNQQDAIITSGLEANDKLVLTSLGQVSSGTPVSILGDSAYADEHHQTRDKMSVEQILQRMPEDRRNKLELAAKERGVSVEQILQERRKKRADGHKGA